MKKILCVIVALAVLLLAVVGCGSSGIPEDFAFSVSSSTQGRVFEYHSEGNLLVKKNTTEGAEQYTAELVLSASEMKTAWDLLSLMQLENYPDAPETYDPGTPNLSLSTTDLRLWVRYNGEEKMIFAENISTKGNPNTADGIAFMNATKTLLKIIMATDEYRAMPDWDY